MHAISARNTGDRRAMPPYSCTMHAVRSPWWLLLLLVLPTSCAYDWSLGTHDDSGGADTTAADSTTVDSSPIDSSATDTAPAIDTAPDCAKLLVTLNEARV